MQYVEVLRAVTSVWRGFLSPKEFNTLCFIVDRTLRFNKCSESIPLRHFHEGVFDRTGRMVAAPVGKNYVSLRTAVEKLEERKLISVDRGQGHEASTFTVEVQAIVTGAQRMAQSKLKEPKKKRAISDDNWTDNHLRNCRSSSYESVGSDTTEPQYRSTTSKDTEVNNHNCRRLRRRRRAPVVDSDMRSGDAIHSARTLNVTARRRKASKANERLSKNALCALWADCVSRHREGMVSAGLTTKEFAIFKKCYKPDHLPVPLSDFLEWVVSRWDDLRAREFEWCRKRPMPFAPDIAFLCRMYYHFVRAYGDYVGKTDADRRKIQAALARKEAGNSEYEKQLAAERAEKESLRKELDRATREGQHYRRRSEALAESNRKLKTRAQRRSSDVALEDIAPIEVDWDTLNRQRQTEER